jgi:hypothetical protein
MHHLTNISEQSLESELFPKTSGCGIDCRIRALYAHNFMQIVQWALCSSSCLNQRSSLAIDGGRVSRLGIFPDKNRLSSRDPLPIQITILSFSQASFVVLTPPPFQFLISLHSRYPVTSSRFSPGLRLAMDRQFFLEIQPFRAS